MYVEEMPWTTMAALYSLLLFFAFLWWWFTTKSKYKLLEVLLSLSLIGAAFAVAGGTMLVIDIMGPFSLGETWLIVGSIISIVTGMGWFLLREKGEK